MVERTGCGDGGRDIVAAEQQPQQHMHRTGRQPSSTERKMFRQTPKPRSFIPILASIPASVSVEQAVLGDAQQHHRRARRQSQFCASHVPPCGWPARPAPGTRPSRRCRRRGWFRAAGHAPDGSAG
jgi:hypothetical protein